MDFCVRWKDITKPNIRDRPGSPLHVMWNTSIPGLEEDATAEAPWGCPPGAPPPPPPHNRTPRWFEEMPPTADGKCKEGRQSPLGGHWAWRLSFKKLSKGQLPWAMWGQHARQHHLWKRAWKLSLKKSTLQVHFSKLMQSVSKTKGTLSLPLFEVIKLTCRLES